MLTDNSLRTKLRLVHKDKEQRTLKTIGSFDIGMKNLAVCILDRIEAAPGFRIRQWKLISLVSQQGSRSLRCKHRILPRKKKGLSKKELKGKKCDRKATSWNPETQIGYCKLHLPKDGTPITRYTTCKNITDFELCENLSLALNELPELWTDCSEIVIESQIRSNMKKVANLMIGIVASEKKQHPNSPLKNIKTISASHKLSISSEQLGGEIDLPEETQRGNKNDYEGRKILARDHCQILLQHDPYHLNFFREHTKKDDLADAFLQGLWYLLKSTSS